MKKTKATLRVGRSANAGDLHSAAPALRVQAAVARSQVFDTTYNMIRKRHLVSLGEFQSLMGWAAPQSVTRALASHRIFAMNCEGQRYFPAFFADPLYIRRHLAAVSKALARLPGGAKMQFFASRKGSLSGVTPLEALAEGRLQKVVDLAAAYAEG